MLALDLHPLNFGFALFEALELLDWGIKSFRNGVNAVKVPMNMKMALLLDQCAPDVVVMKKPRTTTIEGMVRTVAALARARRIPVRVLSGASVREAFPDGNRNKYQIATAIAVRFPELFPRLGAPRKLWEHERYAARIFDAAALGVTYFTHEAQSGNVEDITPSSVPH